MGTIADDIWKSRKLLNRDYWRRSPNFKFKIQINSRDLRSKPTPGFLSGQTWEI